MGKRSAVATRKFIDPLKVSQTFRILANILSLIAVMTLIMGPHFIQPQLPGGIVTVTLWCVFVVIGSISSTIAVVLGSIEGEKAGSLLLGVCAFTYSLSSFAEFSSPVIAEISPAPYLLLSLGAHYFASYFRAMNAEESYKKALIAINNS